ncbi:GspH/FimT family pseudopilin [Methylonatrum kenyense]|uniref:GspH/FimT family pseudopilin n=1 Tax=Methylonatrum kenyense TaxID=455253 RepID=UPI0020C06B18|nr:GspH/FimT family pseudopilin [Methylonatrum kenyense]MCK8517110.1 GspH/FimT family pseudopilin [Methylonatrum kenyense]
MTRDGFTLIELLVTIAVLAILVTVAIPAFNQIEQRRTIGAAEDMLNHVQLARTEAIKQGRNIFLVSEGNGGEWCHGISSQGPCSCSETGSCSLVLAGNEEPSEIRTSNEAFRNIAMESDGVNDGVIEFDSVRGTLLGGQARSITFTSSPNNFQMRLEVNPIGRPRLCGVDRPLGAYRQC